MNTSAARPLPALLLCAALAACAPSLTSAPVTGMTASAPIVDASGRSVGTALFEETGLGTRVTVRVSGLAPGVHGTHVHMNGACTDTTDAAGAVVKFGGAGGHFDPSGANVHGGPQDAPDKAHAGDLENTTVDASGNGTMVMATRKLGVSAGATSVAGRSVVIHANADDFRTQPIGGSGGRVACGVISAAR